MRNNAKIVALAFLVQVLVFGATCQARTQAEKSRYPAMAPLNRYFIRDENTEIALARSAAPASISDGAESWCWNGTHTRRR